MSKGKLLEMQKIYKEFPGVVAVNNVDLEVDRGEVLGLIGENGAGKSTLIKILSGAFQADRGTIKFDGKILEKYQPKDTLDLGVAVIYQELNYLNDMSIAENIFLGHLPRNKTLRKVDYKTLEETSRKIQKEVGLDYLPPSTLVEDLSMAEKQLVEIGRAYSRNVKLIVMDEPTSALNEKEIKTLFTLIRKMKRDGIAVIYISHKLDEILEITDRVYVMRDGKTTFDGLTKDTNSEQIVKNMVGREIKDMYPVFDRKHGETILKVTNLNTSFLKNIEFELKRGEILGLFGLMGSGCDDIVKCIFGAQQPDSINLEIDGQAVQIDAPADAIESGIAYVPSERKIEGLILNHTVSQNTTITNLEGIKKGLVIDTGKERNLVKEWIKKLNIKTPSADTEVDSLSGGNQQKVVLAKWLHLNPKVLVMNEPTRGIDVGAKVEIYKLMDFFCNNDLGVIMVSSEMPEMIGVADRILVVSEGEIVSEFSKHEVDQEKLMHSAIGGK